MARKFIDCLKCLQNGPNGGQGLCTRCYRKKYRADNIDQLKQKQREYYKANIETIKVKDKVRKAKAYLNNREKILARNKRWELNNQERVKARRKEYNKKTKKQQQERWKIRYKLNNEYERARKSAYYLLKKPDYIARKRKRDAMKLKRTPKWLTKEQLVAITELYRTCPPGYEVDHIVPLQGKNVSGLHVPWNLQHLPADENRRKGSKHESDEA